ncbi:GntR family transcriptional regulator [Tersicoccus phoenicis]|uniref:GntR family transcriptional regulator n=1 Tax=Tersicoccus phoenicis TaxID=554083 RepID=A0A1R1LLG7_9MICC|nr:GntR family transcriptional regulator [Tersicoccus phoenicis]OMH28329.1 GntR family transcriptional regulator [Tersicoccus phoenicis]
MATTEKSSVATGAETSSKSETAYRYVLERIRSGSYGPGYRLVLSRLADELNMSVVPVREAIRRLESERLITFERNVGATVTGIDPTEYLYTMQTLALVEGYATALCAPLLAPADLARARDVNGQMRVRLADFDPRTFTELNLAFHAILFENCPNPHVLDLVQRGWNRLGALRSSTFAYVPGRAARSVAEHDALLDALAAGDDVVEIERLARRHRLATLEAYLAHAGT